MTKEEEIVAELKVQMKEREDLLLKATEEVRTFANHAKEKFGALEKLPQETKESIDKALVDMNGKVGPIITKMADIEKMIQEAVRKTEARLHEAEQKAARMPGPQGLETKSIGQLFVEAENVKAFLASSSKRGKESVAIDLKTLTSGAATVGAGASPTTSLVAADRVQGLMALPTRRLVVRDLITPGSTNSSHIEYVQETGTFTPAAGVVSEGQTKPYTNVTFDLLSSVVRTIAVMLKSSRQIMDDAPQLQSFIDGRLRYELAYVEEAELLLGDGTGQHLLGIMPQATAYAQSFAPAGTEQALDRLRQAMLQGALALYPPTGFVLHPLNWAQIETLKDSQGRYLIGNPQGTINKTLWGLPVVDTQAMASGSFLTGAFQLGAQIFDRMAIEVLISTENADDFERNMISIRGEERLALCVYRPGAFIKGTLP